MCVPTGIHKYIFPDFHHTDWIVHISWWCLINSLNITMKSNFHQLEHKYHLSYHHHHQKRVPSMLAKDQTYVTISTFTSFHLHKSYISKGFWQCSSFACADTFVVQKLLGQCRDSMQNINLSPEFKLFTPFFFSF